MSDARPACCRPSIFSLMLPLLAALSMPVTASERFLVSAGTQASAHPLDIRTYHLAWQHEISRADTGFSTDSELVAGQLLTNVANSPWAGAGLGLNFDMTPNARFRLGGRINFLQQFEYIYQDDLGVYRIRDYGGKRQFSFSAALNWQTRGGVGVGYRFEHMSNAYLYDSNPGIDTHSLLLYFSLD